MRGSRTLKKQGNEPARPKSGMDYANHLSSMQKKSIRNSSNLMSTQPKAPQSETINDEYIQNLQKQVYYLELEMKLMKDREVETKNKVGGYEILFRDGVPLNEHFLALKTKYTNEKEKFEKMLDDLSEEIHKFEEENLYLKSEIEGTNKNYYDLKERFEKCQEYFKSRIEDLKIKQINENNTKASLNRGKDILKRKLYKYNSDNVHFKRTMKKNELFKDNADERNKVIDEKNKSKLENTDKLVVRSLLEEATILRKMENNTKQNDLENENTVLMHYLNRMDREVHMNKAKITELENTRDVNRKYLKEEWLIKKLHDKESEKLNEELDNLIKVNEEMMRQKVKENEKKQILLIKNKLSNAENRMKLLLENYKYEENIAKELMEEKNGLQQNIFQTKEDIDAQEDKEKEYDQEIIESKNEIDEIETTTEELKGNIDVLKAENQNLKATNLKLEDDIKVYSKKIEEIKKRIELNTILKDVDLNELKTLAQNNSLVNNSINTLLHKWDDVHQKLMQMENRKENDEL